MTITKAELRFRVQGQLDDYLDTATVAKLTQLEAFLTEGEEGDAASEEETAASGQTTIIRFKDRHQNYTEFNLEAGTFTSRAMARTDKPGCCTVEGTGPRLTIDMETMYFHGGDVLEFDAPPENRPVRFSFDDPDAPEATPLEEEADAEEDTTEAEPDGEDVPSPETPAAPDEEEAPEVTVREEGADVDPVRS